MSKSEVIHRRAVEAKNKFNDMFPSSVADKYYCGYRDALQDEWSKDTITLPKQLVDEVIGALEETDMTIGHALALGYLGEGSTNGMAKTCLSNTNKALKALRDEIGE